MSEFAFDGNLCTARIVGMTKPTDEFALTDGIDSPRDLIAYCARVSNPDNQTNKDTAEGLLRYLIREKHWSPFEMVNILVEISLPRDIGRQLLRHRFGFQEFSQRYAKVSKFALRKGRMQHPTNRQASIEMADPELQADWRTQQTKVLEQAMKAYDWAIERGIAKESARVVLPEGLTMSTMYVNGTIRSWIHYLELRLANGTQIEHRALAYCISAAIAQAFGSIPLSSYDEADEVISRINQNDSKGAREESSNG